MYEDEDVFLQNRAENELFVAVRRIQYPAGWKGGLRSRLQVFNPRLGIEGRGVLEDLKPQF